MQKSLESIFGPNFALVEELYDQYKEDPESVPAYWKNYFDELEGKVIPEKKTQDDKDTGKSADKEKKAAPKADKTNGAPATGKETKQPPESGDVGQVERPTEEEAQAPLEEADLVKIKGVERQRVFAIALKLPKAPIYKAE